MAIILDVKNKKQAEKKVKDILEKNDYECCDSEEINYGMQFKVKYNSSEIGYLRIYESKKGVKLDESQISNNTHKRNIIEIISSKLSKKKGIGKIPLPQTRFFRYPRDKQIIEKIKEMLIKEFREGEKTSYSNKIYFIKLNDLTITQFKNGTWMIQGKSSKLSDEIIKRVDEIYSETAWKELIRIIKHNLPTYNETEFKKVVDELKDFEIDLKQNIPQTIYSYLNPNDRIEIRDGILLFEFVKKQNLPLKNFACLVRNFAIVYEGFLIKLLSDLHLLDLYSFISKSEVKIGIILKSGKIIKKYPSVKRVKPALCEKMWVVWQECRNDYIHSDFIKFPRIKDIRDAENKIKEIIDVMKDCLDVFGKIVEPNLEDINGESIIGIDEAGKGDYFGPLVVAAVYVDKNVAKFLSSIGVRDSKKLSDFRISDLYDKIISKCEVSVVKINPRKYNELYQKIGNLNQLLAWGHARALENILQKAKCKYAISDQFGDGNLIKSKLMQLGKTIFLIQKPKADEENIAVAAASIVTRYEFLKELEILSRKYQLHFPKGASEEVEKTAKEFINKYGKERLSEVAKLHFKISKRL